MRGFQVKDIVDIAIVAVLIYGIINLLRESRAGQLVKGLLFLIAILLVSMLLDLSMLNNILQYFFEYAFIAVLVVFQPEIRKALEQMGRSNVGKSLANAVGVKDKHEEQNVIRKAINAVVDSYGSLQKLKMGAIVVFERKTKLGDIAESGTAIDAEASSKMLSNIFFNKAPLHDGAVVIRNGRIHSAGCILPLTRNDTLSESVGTRHRAALGISEESDCVVVVLSEETGQISIATEGNLKRDYNKDTLREALSKYLIENMDENRAEKKIKSVFRRKKGIKNGQKKEDE